jgi:intein-encoded DNA endonuclease-like protein
MLTRAIWFTIGFAVAKVTSDTDCVKKVKRFMKNCSEEFKKEFIKKEKNEAS